MPLPTAYELVRTALGGSVISEEMKGDFTLARATAEKLNADALVSGDPRRRAGASLARGLAHLMQAEPVAALGLFAEAEHGATEDPEIRLLAFAWSSFASRSRFMFLPNGCGPVLQEAVPSWNLSAATAAAQERWPGLLAAVRDPEVRFEAELLYQLQSDLPLARYVLDRIFLVSDEQRTLQAGGVVGNVLSFLQKAMAAGAPAAVLAYVNLQLAGLHRRAGDLAAAREHLVQSHSLYSQAGDAVGAAACFMCLGDWQAATGSSPAVWNLALLEGVADHRLLPMDEESERSSKVLDPAAALGSYARAEEGFLAAGSSRGLAALELRRGYLRSLAADWPGVTEHARRAEDLFTAAGDSSGAWLARCHRILALIGGPARAEDVEAAEAAGRWGRDSGCFSFTLGLGLMLSSAGRQWLIRDGDIERALACHRLAQKLCEALGAPLAGAQNLTERGKIFRLSGEQDAAREAYEAAREALAARLGSAGLTTGIWQRAILTADGVVEIDLERSAGADLERSVRRLRSLHASPPPPDGSDLFAGSLPTLLDRFVGHRIDLASVMGPLCRAWEAQETGTQEEVHFHLESAWAAAQVLRGAEGYFYRAVVLRGWHLNAEAVDAFERFAAVGAGEGGLASDIADFFSQGFGKVGRSLAEDRIPQLHYLGAQFFALTGAPGLARLRLGLLEAAAGPDWWQRIDRPWEALAVYGDTAEASGHFAEAVKRYDNALSVLEERRGLLSRDDLKIGVASGKSARRLHLRAAAAALQAGSEDAERSPAWISRAFAFAERGKARALLDLLAARADTEPAGAPEIRAVRRIQAHLSAQRGLLSRERRLAEPDAERVAQFSRQIETDEAELRRLEAAAVERSAAFVQRTALTLEEVRELLPEGSALLLYFFGDDELMVWGLSHSLVRAHREKLDTRHLARQMRDFHAACVTSLDYEHLGETLARSLLQPMAELIGGCSHLILVPHGVMHSLPFAVLPWQGSPLGLLRVLSHLPSASSLRFLRRPREPGAPRKILAVGNPARMECRPPGGGPALGLLPLRGAAAEAAFVASLYPEAATLLESRATAEAVRTQMHGRQVLHFATHGVLWEEAPLLSSILLADGQSLTVEQLMGEHLDADLVVLSACETGRGRSTGGDEVLGLTRGLLAAGALAAVVSLWPVRDSAASLLMGELHRRLRAGASPAEALQQAQIYLRGLTRGEARAALDQLRMGLADLSEQEPIQRSFAELLDGGERGGQGLSDSRAAFSLPYFWASFIVVGASDGSESG